MNELIEEIKTKAQKYGLCLRFMGQGEGFLGDRYNTIAVTTDDTVNDVLKRIDEVIKTRGDLLLLKVALTQ